MVLLLHSVIPIFMLENMLSLTLSHSPCKVVVVVVISHSFHFLLFTHSNIPSCEVYYLENYVNVNLVIPYYPTFFISFIFFFFFKLTILLATSALNLKLCDVHPYDFVLLRPRRNILEHKTVFELNSICNLQFTIYNLFYCVQGRHGTSIIFSFLLYFSKVT